MKAAWLTGALLIGAAVFVGLDTTKTLLIRAISMTTADPASLGLVAFNSNEPAILSLRATREMTNDNKYNDTEQSIRFKLPAAYVTLIDVKDPPPSRSHRLGFQVWSRTFDAVTPDESAEYRLCKSKFPCSGGPYSQRILNRENVVRIEITNLISVEARRQRVLEYQSGIDLREGYYSGRPCAIGYDKRRDLITLDAPPDQRHGESCNFSSNGYTYRGAVRAVPRNFAKRNPNGTLRYAVKCNGFSEDVRAESMCRFYAYFGIWPIFFWARPSQIDEWDEIYDGVVNFL